MPFGIKAQGFLPKSSSYGKRPSSDTKEAVDPNTPKPYKRHDSASTETIFSYPCVTIWRPFCAHNWVFKPPSLPKYF